MSGPFRCTSCDELADPNHSCDLGAFVGRAVAHAAGQDNSPHRFGGPMSECPRCIATRASKHVADEALATENRALRDQLTLIGKEPMPRTWKDVELDRLRIQDAAQKAIIEELIEALKQARTKADTND
jgi:hypothetical protein